MSWSVYTVADSGHFPGVVALVNSLRLAGHEGRIVVADVGLTAHERGLLAPEAAVRRVPRERVPNLLKTVLPIDDAAETMILVDADVIVLGPLASVLEGWDGALLAFADPVADRFCPEWGSLGLGPATPGGYVNAGFLALRGPEGRRLLDLVHTVQGRIDPAANRYAGPTRPGGPFYYGDQDVWNAVLATGGRRRLLHRLESRLAPHPPFAGLSERGEGRLAYADGVEPWLLHHVLAKPWLGPTRANAYSRLLPSLTIAEKLPIRIEADRLPVRFRGGWRGKAAASWAGVRSLATAQRGRLGVRRRLARIGARRHPSR